MYSQRTFVYEEGEESGLIGLRPLWMRKADPTTAVAHDVLEHFSGNEQLSATEDELLALGALLALRIENGLFNQYYHYDHQLAQVVYSVLSDLELSDEAVPRALPLKPLHSDFEWAQGAIRAALPQALKQLAGEHEDSGVLRVLEECPDLAQRVEQWIRTGYQRTWQRFDGVDLYWLGGTFYRRLDEVSRKLVSSEMLSFGDRVQFVVNAQEQYIGLRVNGQSLALEELGL